MHASVEGVCVHVCVCGGGGCTRLRIGYLCSVCCVLSILLRLHGPRKPNYADVHNCDDVIRQRVEAGFVMAG